MSTLAPWLKAHLEKAGVIDHNGIGRRARPRACRHCGDTILTGLDGDDCALVVEADPIPLSPLGEALALIDGRRTVTLTREAGRYVLGIRYDLMIEQRPAGSQLGTDVLASHECQRPIPAAWSAPSMLPSFNQKRLQPNAEPPF